MRNIGGGSIELDPIKGLSRSPEETCPHQRNHQDPQPHLLKRSHAFLSVTTPIQNMPHLYIIIIVRNYYSILSEKNIHHCGY